MTSHHRYHDCRMEANRSRLGANGMPAGNSSENGDVVEVGDLVGDEVDIGRWWAIEATRMGSSKKVL